MRKYMVGRYIGGAWDSGGVRSDYEGDKSISWIGEVVADNHDDAIRKAKPKYYREMKKKRMQK